MSQTLLPPGWVEKLCDPYAVLGISVIADDRQIFKRYHTLAKLLHPDRHAKNCNPDQKLATAIFSHLINPAYQQLKHRQKRLIAIAMLRSDARVLEQKPLSSQSAIAQEIMKMSTPEAELFYEEAIACYAEAQYKSLDQFYQVTQQITILNLVYLRLHKPDLFLPQKTVPIISEVEVNPVELTLTDVKPVLTNYSQRHYQRAIEYVRLGKWTIAVQELRDAIKLEPNNSDYYALLGLVHLKQKFMGMARVYICQALKLNPKNSLALKYAPELKIQLGENTNPKSMAKAMSIAALLSRFTQRKGSQVKC
ncbi:DnaJ domain-containing protein [Nostoc sp. ATCC 53789]|jgi:tetratricopeptide (TPR) repeat protein|uniref:J domain-containing protein n=1 Tax=unclassified Nostoc TaxID=2593658 RepID=UPI000DECA2E5|nr:DnaJ domain-containing protein [Nostoc sp. ATCC 53789]QHG17718.1 DnaJ domain-containing protein [Nostoc sp. ATCC 53789]RCJ32183.1 molecular chaperone DnaJ [Nostoc sp. ATCC 53789]